MIEYKTGDLLAEPAEALVNAVNCVGVMGRGVALQFKNAFPENFQAYELRCRRGGMRPGEMFVFELQRAAGPRYIINFPTKRHWRGKSRMADIEAGLRALAEEIRAREIRSIALPPLGCGLGGLDWPEVRARMQTALENLPEVRIAVFEPDGGRTRRPSPETPAGYPAPPESESRPSSADSTRNPAAPKTEPLRNKTESRRGNYPGQGCRGQIEGR